MWVVQYNGEYYAVDSAANAAYWARTIGEALQMTYEEAIYISNQFGGKPIKIR